MKYNFILLTMLLIAVNADVHSQDSRDDSQDIVYHDTTWKYFDQSIREDLLSKNNPKTKIYTEFYYLDPVVNNSDSLDIIIMENSHARGYPGANNIYVYRWYYNNNIEEGNLYRLLKYRNDYGTQNTYYNEDYKIKVNYGNVKVFIKEKLLPNIKN